LRCSCEPLRYLLAPQCHMPSKCVCSYKKGYSACVSASVYDVEIVTVEDILKWERHLRVNM
jgi:hypothetical protein